MNDIKVRRATGLFTENGRGRVRCVSPTGWWRDCKRWGNVWVTFYDPDEFGDVERAFCWQHAYSEWGVLGPALRG